MTKTPPNNIRALRLAHGWSQEQLAAACRPQKTSQPQIDRLEKGLRRLTQEWMDVIAAALDVDAAALLPLPAGARPHVNSTRSPRAPTPHRKLSRGAGEQLKRTIAARKQSALEFMPGVHATFAGPRDLPILGHVKAGGLGFFIGNGERQGVTVRPDPLRDVKDAYAVRVHDDSMSPALEPGYLLYVDPTRPVKPGDNVIIQLKDGQAFIKRLTRRTEKATICRQFNPPQEVRYDPGKIRAVHLVVQVSMIDL